MTDARQARADNYAAKRAASFRCGECPDTGQTQEQLLVCEDGVVRCQHHLGDHPVRPHQWDAAEKLRAELRKAA
jgi:hypothetical protein